MTPAARLQAAITLLEAIDEAAPKPADRVASAWFKQRRYIGSKDRRAVSELVWGCLRAQARLGWWLERLYVPDGARARVLAFALLEQGTSAEELLRLLDGGDRYGPPSSDAAEADWIARLAGQPLEHAEQPPSVALEVPEWLLPRFEAALGPRAEAELRAMRAPAEVDLRVNRLKATRESARNALAEEGIPTWPGQWSPLALRADGRRPVAATRAFRDGLVEVQDEGSQLVALLTGARPGMRVCDFCAGAGGKTLALAGEMDNRGQLVACDVLEKRLERSALRLRRSGVHNATRRPLSSERDPWVKRHKGSFDRVLVDAPCSGSGTWRRNPEARWRFDETGLDELLALQASILESAARLVRPGGRLAYATCSLLREENEQQVERFLGAREDFRLRPLAELWEESMDGAPPCEGQTLRLTPAQHGTDGFFVAVLERVAPGVGEPDEAESRAESREEKKP